MHTLSSAAGADTKQQPAANRSLWKRSAHVPDAISLTANSGAIRALVCTKANRPVGCHSDGPLQASTAGAQKWQVVANSFGLLRRPRRGPRCEQYQWHSSGVRAVSRYVAQQRGRCQHVAQQWRMTTWSRIWSHSPRGQRLQASLGTQGGSGDRTTVECLNTERAGHSGNTEVEQLLEPAQNTPGLTWTAQAERHYHGVLFVRC